MGLPLHGVRETLLPPGPPEAEDGLREVIDGVSGPQAGRQVRAIVAAHPTFLAGWANLAERTLDHDPVAAYAFARVGYHRGLDAIRKAGWGGQGPVPWRHEPNRGFLASVFTLMRAASAIGETEEVARCRDFLLALDPEDGQEVRTLELG
jgi:hypothetical protein